jgi:hypothetical protein
MLFSPFPSDNNSRCVAAAACKPLRRMLRHRYANASSVPPLRDPEKKKTPCCITITSQRNVRVIVIKRNRVSRKEKVCARAMSRLFIGCAVLCFPVVDASARK